MTLSEHDFAVRVLLGDTLDDKLQAAGVLAVDARAKGAVYDPAFPGRPPGLRPGDHAPAPFPKREALADPRARGRVLHFFANHELLALELMALALLRFPDAPASFRQGLISTMHEEQAHLRLYLGRMAELGVAFGELGVSDFFWQALRGMRTPFEYIAGMSLTIEQANLDFSVFYRDQFAAVGDATTAAILDRVYREEIGHVKHGLVWFDRWRPPALEPWDGYLSGLRPPLSPARAKAQPFNREGRLAAGLSEAFIRRLEVFGGSKGRPPAVLWFNPDVEREVAQALARDKPRPWGGYASANRLALQLADAEGVLTFLAKAGDVVLCRREPSLAWLAEWQDLGAELPEYRLAPEPLPAIRALGKERTLGALKPWGWGPQALSAAAELRGEPFDKEAAAQTLWHLYAKTGLPALRSIARRGLPGLAAALGPELMDGRLVTDAASLGEVMRETLADLGTSVLVKAPFSAAGRERLCLKAGEDIGPAAAAWLAKAWRQWGALLAEPFVEVVADASLVGEVGGPKAGAAALTPTVFYCNPRGQYRGHRLVAPGAGFGAAAAPVRAFLSAPGPGGHALHRALTAAAVQVFEQLARCGYKGPAGIDFHAYRLPASSTPNKLYLQPISEVNARTTMGHVAVALGKLLAPGAQGLWLTLRQEDLTPDVGATFPALAAHLRREFPLNPGPKLRDACYFVNDPATAEHSLGIVAVGEKPMAQLAALARAGQT